MDKIEVTQADREVVRYWLDEVCHKPLANQRELDLLTQAFAAHRTTRTDATPVAWHSPLGSLIEARQIAQQVYRDIEREKAINGHVPGNPYDVALAGLNSVLGCLAELVTHPPATDVAALVEALRFYAGLLPFPYNAWVHPSVVDYSKGGDGHHPDGPPIPSDTLLLDGGKHARQALAPFTKGQP